MINVSSNFKMRILGQESFADIFNGGRIAVFSGPQPASADFAGTGTVLGYVTDQGLNWQPDGGQGGLNFVIDGVWAAQDPTQLWQLKASVAGTTGWFRLFGKSLDSNSLSINAPRIDGTVGAGGTVDMVVPTSTLTAGYSVVVQQFLFSFPPILG